MSLILVNTLCSPALRKGRGLLTFLCRFHNEIYLQTACGTDVQMFWFSHVVNVSHFQTWTLENVCTMGSGLWWGYGLIVVQTNVLLSDKNCSNVTCFVPPLQHLPQGYVQSNRLSFYENDPCPDEYFRLQKQSPSNPNQSHTLSMCV